MNEERIKTLEKNITENNSYITKLEAENKKLKETSNTNSINPDEYNLLKEKTLRREMREDANEAKAQLIAEYGQEVYSVLASKHDEFSNKQIKPENSSVQFFKSTFELVYAREMKNKDSELYLHYQKTFKPAEPVPAPEPNPTNPKTPGQVPPPIINDGDNPGGDPNPPKGQTVENVDKAYDALQKTLAGVHMNPYEK